MMIRKLEQLESKSCSEKGDEEMRNKAMRRVSQERRINKTRLAQRGGTHLQLDFNEEARFGEEGLSRRREESESRRVG